MTILTNRTRASVIQKAWNGEYSVTNLLNYEGNGQGQVSNYKDYKTFKTLKGAERFANEHLNS